MSGNRSHESVSALAYRLWEQRGGSGGSAEDDWFQAEQMLAGDLEYGESPPQMQQATPRAVETKVDRTVEESFPASDPPAVHIKDDPPVNAGDKWKAVNEAKDAAPAKPVAGLKPGKPVKGGPRRGANP